MASRKTRTEAEQLKEELEARYPNATIVIEKKYREAQVSPYGLGTTYQEEDIIRYEGDFPVVGGTSFSIFELAHCYLCKEEMKSSAIGEKTSSGKFVAYFWNDGEITDSEFFDTLEACLEFIKDFFK